jgi:hypothetical protein
MVDFALPVLTRERAELFGATEHQTDPSPVSRSR